MKNKKPLIILAFLCCQSILFAQHEWCGFHALDTIHNQDDHRDFERLLKSRANRTTEDPDAIFLIPVVVHVIHNNTTDAIGLGDNISDEQIFTAIEVLNEDFRRKNPDTVNTPNWAKPVAADVQIEFRLASQDPDGFPTDGITRTKGNKNSYNYISDEVELKGYSYWPSSEYLNIWVASLSNNIVGFAQFPDNSNLVGVNDTNGSEELDGIVVAPYSFGRLEGKATGTNNPYKFGRTAVHEVGHWLGLRHIFNNRENGCNYSDYCEDTPEQDKSNISVNDCNTEIIGGCGAVVMHQNYMDYTNDICMNLFTQDQKSRMQQVLSVSPRRAALKFSKGLCGSSEEIAVPSIETFLYDQIFFSKWELSGSNTDLFDWELETGEIKSTATDSITTDSLILTSGVITYNSNSNLFLRFDGQSLTNADSIKIFYERACSGNLNELTTVSLDGTSIQDEKISLKNLAESGLLQFYFVVYNNGNEVIIKNISFYEESSELQVELFPNPSDGNVSYSLNLPSDQEIVVQVFNLNGKLVFENSYESLYTGIYSLDLTALLNGLYIAKFTGESETKSVRFLKQ